MNKPNPRSVKALVENGRGGFSSLNPLTIPYISETAECLIIDGIHDLTLVGRVDKEGKFMSKGIRRDEQRSVAFYVARLKPRLIVLRDGRVYYNDSGEDSST